MQAERRSQKETGNMPTLADLDALVNQLAAAIPKLSLEWDELE